MSIFLKNYKHLLISAAIFAAIMLCLPPRNGLTTAGVVILAIFFSTVYLWITVGVDWTSFLAIIALGCVPGVFTMGTAFAQSFGNFMVPLMLATMLMNDIIQRSGITKKLATWFITRKIVRNRPWVFIGMFIFSGMVMQMFMELIPPVLIMMAMAESVCEGLGYKKGDSFTKCLILGILWTSVVAFGSSPIAHGAVVMILSVVQNTVGQSISFLQYMMVGIPFALLFFVGVMLVIRFVMRPDVSKFVNYDIESRKSDLEPLSTEAKISLFIFAIVVLMWILPDFGIYISFLKPISAFLKSMGPAFPPICGACAMAIIRVKNKPILELGPAFKNVAWGSIIFCASIALLSGAMGNPSVGINAFLTNILSPLASNLSPVMIVIVALLIALVMTNFTSNVVTAILVFSIFAPVLVSLVSGNIAAVIAMGVAITVMSNTAFLTPPANIASPIIFGSGHITMGDSFKYGSLLMLYSFIIMVIIINPLSKIVFGA